MKQMGLRQNVVAEAVRVTPAAVSKFLLIGPNALNFDDEKVEKLFAALSERLSIFAAIKDRREEYAKKTSGKQELKAFDAELEGEFGKKDVAKTDELSRDDLNSIKASLARIKREASSEDNEVLVAPGGPMPFNASNYIDRVDDGVIDRILTTGEAAASIVVAPVNGGTSTFLTRVYHQASQMDGCWVKIVHMEPGFPDGETYDQYDFFKYLFRQIGVPKEILKDETLDAEDLRDEFVKWAETEWTGKGKVVLIVDGLDQVFKNARSITDALALVNWMMALRNAMAYGEEPFDRLVLFTALTGKTWSAAHASPFASQAKELKLEKLDKRQVAQVMKAHGKTLLDDELDAIMGLFHGHPYLVHLFAWAMHEGSGFDEARRLALELEGRYQTHWDRLKKEIAFLIGDEDELDGFFRAVKEIGQVGTLSGLSEQAAKAHRAYGSSLHVFGLLDGSKSEPTICEFYLNAIEKHVEYTKREGL